MQSSIYSAHVQTLIFHFIQMRLCSQCTKKKKHRTRERTPCWNDHRLRFPLFRLMKNGKSISRALRCDVLCIFCAKFNEKKNRTSGRHRNGKYGSSQNRIYQSSLHNSNFYEIPISSLYQIIFYQNDISNGRACWTSAINFSFINAPQTWQKKTDKQSINLEIIKSWQCNACNLFYSNFNVVINIFSEKKSWSVHRIGKR